MTIHDSIKDIMPWTSGRVPLHTAQKVNTKIHEETLHRLHDIGSDSKKIDARLKELEQEWDIERTIEANASTIALTGVILGATLDKRWLILPGLVAGFLLQHAVLRSGFKGPQLE